MPADRSLVRVALLACLCFAKFSTAGAAPPTLPALELDNPAPGVYVHYGKQETMSRENFGDIANIGFIVGDRCAAVVDTGGTYAVGRALHAALRRVTALPICS